MTWRDRVFTEIMHHGISLSTKLNFGKVAVAWLLLLWSGSVCAGAAPGDDLQITGQAAVLMEMHSGKILWQRNKDLPLAPASTTKILTALIALERSRPTDIAIVPAQATSSSGGSANLQKNEKLTVEQLVSAMLMGSANDAAITLATHTGGSLAKFIVMMNDRARALGALHSNFHNPTGVSQKGHVTTARDLAIIARAALANSLFQRIVATKSLAWKSAKWEGEMKNSNLLLDTYPGAIGVKTGQTREAGYCLVAAATRAGKTLIAVILKSTEKAVWQDATTLLDHGYRNFAAISLVEPDKTILTSKVAGKKIAIAAAAPARYVGPPIDGNPPQMQIVLDELALPIAKGEKVGEAVFRKGDVELVRVDLIARTAVLPPRLAPPPWLVGAASALLLGASLFWLRRHRRRKRYIFARRGSRLRF
jgi:D-alanyl-D-alanine carboxypeptidase (penicillin-binding protein 5/6)